MKHTINKRTFGLNRRTFLRSTSFGVSTVVALPLLEAMFKTDHAYAMASLDTVRMFAFYVPNGISQKAWWPNSTNKTDWSLRGTSNESFETMGLKDDISLYRNMTNVCDPEKSTGNAHLIGIASWLTGHGIQPHDGLRDSDMATRHRMSMEQEVADFANSQILGRTDNLPNPDLRCLRMAGNSELDAGRMDYNNAQKNALNWSKSGRILPLVSDIASQFDNLYSADNRPPSTGGGGSGLSRREQLKLSILDEVKDERQALLQRLGADDRLRVELYFSALEDIEGSIKQMQEMDNQNNNEAEEACVPPISRSDARNASVANGQRAPEIGRHMKVAAKLFPHAMSCGLIHGATYCAGGEAAGCTYNDIGLNKHFHNTVSHGRNDSNDWKKVDKHHSDHAALMLKELKDIKVGDGTMLDNTAFLYGSGLGDGDKHSHTGIGLILAGRFGNWRHGLQHNLSGQSHARLIDTIRRELGMKTLGKGSVPIN